MIIVLTQHTKNSDDTNYLWYICSIFIILEVRKGSKYMLNKEYT